MEITASARTQRTRQGILAAGFAVATLAAVAMLSLLTVHGVRTAMHYTPAEALEAVVAEAAFL